MSRPDPLNGKDLLLEIGCEELPAGYILPVLEGMRGQIEDSLKRNLISIGKIKTYGTPRRLILHIKDVALRQNDIVISGPPKKIAYDEKGRPTKALLNFLKAKGARLADLRKEGIQQRVAIRKKGVSTIRLLKDVLPQLIRALRSPKQMRWESTELRFARPIRWILCLYGDRKVSFRLGSLTTDRFTYGPRELGSRPIKVKDVESYFKILKSKKVIFDQDKRKDLIKYKLQTLAKRAGASDRLDEALLCEVNFLVECPKAFLGSFDEEYLSLPDEVLIASMSKYQRVFALRDRRGKLIPRFLGVANTVKGDLRTIRKNYENILDARLKDSLFFYDEDMKQPLAKRVDELKGLIFLEGLGSFYEKTQRLLRLSNFIAERLSLDEEDKRKLREVARLAKTDLTTHMVGEFPSLQGVMGREYAKAQGLDKAVARGIYEHYLPRFSQDVPPKTILGQIVSISDKIDTIVGCFVKGKHPTASFDPYAIRRRQAAIIQIIVTRKINLSLRQLLDKSIDCYQQLIVEGITKDKLIENLIRFFKERFISIARQRFRYDIVDAVCQIELDDIYDAYKRIEDLTGISRTEAFEMARNVVERTNNILKGAKFDVKFVKPGLLIEPQEKELWKIYNDNQSILKSQKDRRDYRSCTKTYGEIFFAPIHRFFDKVLVNVPDRKLCHNRMALMKAINRLYTQRVADLSKIVVEKR